MKNTQVVYMHGGEAFDGFWEGAQSYWGNTLSKWFQLKKGSVKKWPDRLVQDLSDRSVIKLSMPSKYNAKYVAWAKHFESAFSTFDKEVVLLGWSLGANFMAKYLSENSVPFNVKSVHLVAGCYGLGGGFDLSDDFPNKLRKYVVHLYHSKDDFVVDFNDFEKYKADLPAAVTHVFKNRNHFLQPEFPELIESLKAVSMKLK